MTKCRDPDKQLRATKNDASGKKKTTSSVTCFVCGEVGHYALECKLKKCEDTALVIDGPVKAADPDGEIENGVAYVISGETVLFSRDDVLPDSQASVNVFCKRDLLNNVRKSGKRVALNVVQAGVIINLEGDCVVAADFG